MGKAKALLRGAFIPCCTLGTHVTVLLSCAQSWCAEQGMWPSVNAILKMTCDLSCMQFHAALILPFHIEGTPILVNHLSAPSWCVWSNLLSVYKTEKSEKVVELFFIQELKMFKEILQNRNKSCGGIVNSGIPCHTLSSQRNRQQYALPECAWPLPSLW